MPRTKGLSAAEPVLGLVIKQPDHRFSLERRLQERFRSAQLSSSTAYGAIGRLQQKGYVRPAAEGESRAADRARKGIYEATPEGVEHFRDWLRGPCSASVLREELHARIALCEPRDLPHLIDVVYVEEQACIGELDRIRERMVSELGADGPLPLAEREWSELMDGAVVQSEVDHWGGRRRRLVALRSYLEELRPEAERRALAAHRRSLAEDRRTA
jgi:DNA-binding PadR family transcriptional regulator